MNPRLAALVLILMGALVVACGSDDSKSPAADAGTATEGGTSSDGGALDGSNGSDAAADGGACVTAPNIGDACNPGQIPCDRVDPCCAQTFVCDEATRKWKESGVACFQCEGFACGTQTCAGGGVCLARGSGIDGGSTSYECVSIPAACARNWSCECLTKNLPANCTLSSPNGCSEQGVHVTLSCMGS